jgi:magnesium-transporting ATPase (P-type)
LQLTSIDRLDSILCSINTAIGIIQEGSAEQAAEALKAMLSADAVVVREGTEVKVPANLIVPGDVIILGLGDRIPADLRMIEVSNMATAEAALTGESVPIEKVTESFSVPVGTNPNQVPLGDRKNMCFSATLVAQGSGAGIVIATGDYTEIGTINKLVNKVEKKKTAVLEQIDIVSTYLAIFIGFIAVFTFLYCFFTLTDEQGNRINWLSALNISLVCAVAMIPEGLEAIVTVVYAWAVSKMAKENAIVRALPAVETLGSVTVICSDKTGTLTTNVMSLTAFVTSNAHYRNNVHASERTPKNLVREDEYLGERSDIAKQISAKEAIMKGAGTSRHTRKGNKEFQYTMSAVQLKKTWVVQKPLASLLKSTTMTTLLFVREVLLVLNSSVRHWWEECCAPNVHSERMAVEKEKLVTLLNFPSFVQVTGLV